MSLPADTDLSTARTIPSTHRARPILARRVLLEAVFLGAFADALLRNGFGLGLAVWMAVFAMLALDLVRARGDRARPEQLAWLTTAFVFAACFAWRDNAELRGYDFAAMLGALAILGATLARGSLTSSILGQRVRDLAVSLGAVVKQVIGGVISLVFADSAPGELLQSWRAGRGNTALRAVLLTLPLLAIFGLLFGAADPMFEKLLSIPAVDWGLVASHIVVTGFFTWVVGGWMRGALVLPRRGTPVAEELPFALGTLEVTAILGGLVALFALFVGVQVGWLFGGERLVRSTTGLSYAQYARHGFFELVWVSVLVLPVLLGVHATIRRDDMRALRRHRQLSLVLLVLLGGVMASALGRMALYVHYYGVSVDRLFASVFMGWLALVFVWLAVTVLRGRPRDFAAGMTITGFLTLGALNAINPARLVARANIAHAHEALALSDSVAVGQTSASDTSPIDYTYLTSLDGDAVGVIVDALAAPPVAPSGTPAYEHEMKARCLAAREMLRWADPATQGERHRPDDDWRTWNAGAWNARRSVLQHERGLRAMACAPEAGLSAAAGTP